MTDKNTFIFVFALGTIFSCLSLIKDNQKKFSFGDVAAIVGMMGLSLLLVWAKMGSSKDFEATFFLALIIFYFIYGITFKKEILPRISNFTVYYFTLVAWYYFFFAGLHENESIRIIFYAAVVPTVVTVLISFGDIALNKAGRVFNYLWYMALMVFIGVLNFRSEYLEFFRNGGNVEGLNYVGMFFAGMSLNFTAIMLSNLFRMVPIPHRSQSIKDRVRGWYADIEILESKSSDWRVPLGRELALTVIFVVGAFLNYAYQWVSSYLLGIFAIVAMPLLFTLVHAKQAEVAPEIEKRFRKTRR